MKNPIQPLATDDQGVLRFKENKIVSHFYEWAKERGMGLNELACMDFTQDDCEQFAQLIGYSLSGYSDLSYVSDATYGAAQRISEDPAVTHMEARIVELEAQLEAARNGLREPIAKLFGIHPDDLGR